MQLEVGHPPTAQGGLGRRVCDWQKVYRGVICPAGRFALLLRFFLNTRKLMAFRSRYLPRGLTGRQTKPCTFPDSSASHPHFLLSLYPAAKILSIFDNFHFLFFHLVFSHVFFQLFLPINLLRYHHLFFFSHFSSFFYWSFPSHPRYLADVAGRVAIEGNV